MSLIESLKPCSRSVFFHSQNERKYKDLKIVFKPFRHKLMWAQLQIYIWKLLLVVGNGLILTLFLSSFAVYSDCWEKGITQTNLCQRRGIDGHFIPIPVVIGLWYGFERKKYQSRIVPISKYKRECSYLKRNELQRLKCNDTCNPIDFRGMASSYGRISTDSANLFFCKLVVRCLARRTSSKAVFS